MRISNEELLTELKLRYASEKSLKKKYLLKQALDAISEL